MDAVIGLALALTAPLRAASDTTDVQSVFLQYGAIGAIAVVLLAFSYSAVKRERDRADRAEADLRDLNAVVREKIMPLAADLIRAAAELTQERRR